ncbi:MAG: vanadium-dependent haloperoxidase [Candidatus Zixiibacteriota bacterium]
MRHGHGMVVAAALILSVACGLIGCSDEPTKPANELKKYDAEVATAWFGLMNELVKSEGVLAPAAARIYGYAGVALYESVVGGMSTHRSLIGQLNELDSLPLSNPESAYHWPAVASSALAEITRRLFPDATTADSAAIANLEERFTTEFRPQVGQAMFNRSVSFGRAVGTAVFDWAFTDGTALLSTCTFVQPVGTGLWVPTPPGYLPALLPCWGDLRLFALNVPADCQPISPPPYDENPQSPYYAETREVYDTVNNLTNDQRDIALYWSDESGTSFTPPGHWIAILGQVVDTNAYTLDIAVEAYARLGIALADAFISCWRTKFQYNLLRPITAIRDFMDETWTPLLITPSFPEYTSEHSVQSAAAAQVLTDMFGHMPFVDHTHDGRGLAPRDFNSFFDAANEAAVSCLYGGIHFRSAIARGQEQGICIGHRISALAFRR